MDREFLTGEALSEGIKHICRGEDVCCAVAFWGANCAKAVFGSKAAMRRARILCDITLKSTSKRALKSLGAPTNDNLKHRRRLHAKIYLSDRGVIVGSANASANGIGFDDAARFEEAGVYQGPETAIWGEVKKWFDRQYKAPSSLPVGQTEYDNAPIHVRGSEAAASQHHADSILSQVLLDAAAFRSVGFVFTSTKSGLAERRAAQKVMADGFEDQEPSEPDHMVWADPGITADQMKKWSWKTGDTYSGWGTDGVRDFPRLFLAFWRDATKERRVEIYGERAVAWDLRNDQGMVLCRHADAEVRKEVGFTMPERLADAAKQDDARAYKILNIVKDRAFKSAGELADFMVNMG